MSRTYSTINLKRMFALLTASFIGVSAQAQITQTSSDPAGSSGFTSGARWSDTLVPHSDADYTVSTVLRTPADGSSPTFGGRSMLITSTGSLNFKGTGTATPTITVNNLTIRTGGFITNTASANSVTTPFTLAGSLIINTGNTGNLRVGDTSATQFAGYSVSSTISGGGMLSITNGNTTQSTSAITLTNAGNTFLGGTTVGANAFLIAQADGTLGSGNLTVGVGKLTLQSGVTNNYIADTAAVSFTAGLAAGAINLNYTGSDTVGAISLNGGTSFLGTGTYNAAALNSAYGSNAFAGNGSFTVVPEPSTTSVVVASLLLVVGYLYRRSYLRRC